MATLTISRDKIQKASMSLGSHIPSFTRVIEVPVERIVEVVREIPVEKQILVQQIVEVPVEKIVHVIKEISVEVPVYIEKIVEKEKQVFVEIPTIVKEIIVKRNIKTVAIVGLIALVCGIVLGRI